MVTVGIRNLKDSLSKYLKMVKSGEHIIITDHNKIIAEIIPASANQEPEPKLAKYINEQIETGGISPATKRTEIRLREINEQGTKPTRKAVSQIYGETRSDRE